MRVQATSSGAIFWYVILFAIVVAMLMFTLSRPAADPPVAGENAQAQTVTVGPTAPASAVP